MKLKDFHAKTQVLLDKGYAELEVVGWTPGCRHEISNPFLHTPTQGQPKVILIELNLDSRVVR